MLGGDCTVTLGVTAGLARHQDAGLVYFDGDADLSLPASSGSGVLDTGAFPLANFPHFARLSLAEAAACLGVFCGSRKLAGLVVTEVNPDHDPDGTLVPALIDVLCGALGPAAG